MGWISGAISGGMNLLGSLIPSKTEGNQGYSYGQYQSPEQNAWLQHMQSQYGGMQNEQGRITSQALEQLLGNSGIGADSAKYLSGILSGNQLTPEALNTAYAPYIQAMKGAEARGGASITGKMNKLGIASSGSEGGALNSYYAQSNAQLAKTLAALTQAAQNRQMQGAGLANQLQSIGQNKYNILANILGRQQGLFGEGVQLKNLMPSTVRTGAKGTSTTGKEIGGVII